MTKTQKDDLSPAEIKAILDEMVRAELHRIILDLDAPGPRTLQLIEERVRKLEAENATLREAARLRDYQVIEHGLLEAASNLGMKLEIPFSGALGRQALAKSRALKEAELCVEDGDDIAKAAQELIVDHLAGDLTKVDQAPLSLKMAVDSSLTHAISVDMRNKYAATGRIALEFFGDVTLQAIGPADVKNLMTFILRLPKNHGKNHGKNRYQKTCEMLSKKQEIARADEEDEKHLVAMRARADISDLEKRSQLKDLLVPRQTPANVQHHLNRFRGIFKAAAEHLGYKGECKFISDRDLTTLIKKETQIKDLRFHNTMPKTRHCWSRSRTRQLLLSPVYSGCKSRQRRWQSGDVIIRDSLYWVPLILMTIGSRVEELLRLTKSSVVLRDGVFCLALNVIFAGDGKTESAARYIPVPELLIELGFIEWARDLPGGPMAPLFPEVAHGTSIDRLCDIFSKRCASLFKRLGLKDWHEDLYALRKTLSTSLSVAGIEESKRQVIAGHCGGSILNIHYTSHNAGHLKKVIDLVDFQVQVRWSERHGFPLIVGCNLLIESLADVDVTLADDGSLDVVTVTGEGADIPNQTFHMASENAQQPDQNSFSHSPEAQAAFWLMHALNGRQPRRLRDPRKQQLVEHLLGLAAPVSSVAEVEA